MTTNKTKTILKKPQLSEGLKKRLNEANKLYKKAGDVIQEAYNYAVDVDHYSPQEARQILYDNLSFSKRWIRQFLPEESKMISNRRQTTTTVSEESYDTTPRKWHEKSPPTEKVMQNILNEVFKPIKPGDHDALLPIKEAQNFAKQLNEELKHYPRHAKVMFTVVDGKITFRVTDL